MSFTLLRFLTPKIIHLSERIGIHCFEIIPGAQICHFGVLWKMSAIGVLGFFAIGEFKSYEFQIQFLKDIVDLG